MAARPPIKVTQCCILALLNCNFSLLPRDNIQGLRVRSSAKMIRNVAQDFSYHAVYRVTQKFKVRRRNFHPSTDAGVAHDLMRPERKNQGKPIGAGRGGCDENRRRKDKGGMNRRKNGCGVAT